MALDARRAGALLVGAGGAGAATMLMLLLADLQGLPANSAARLGALGFAFLLTVPLVLGLTTLLKPGAGTRQHVKALGTLGAMLWMGGVGGDLFLPGQGPGMLTALHASALLGGLAFAGAGLASRPLSRAERRRGA